MAVKALGLGTTIVSISVHLYAAKSFRSSRMWHFLIVATQVVECESLLAVHFATIQLCLMVPSYNG